MTNFFNNSEGDQKYTGTPFMKGAVWAAKHDPTLHNSIYAVLENGDFEMTDGEIYHGEALLSTHSYIPVEHMGFANDISEGVDPAAIAEIERRNSMFGLDLVEHATEVEDKSVVKSSTPDFSKMTMMERAAYEAEQKLGTIGWDQAKASVMHNGDALINDSNTAINPYANAQPVYQMPEDPQFQAFVTMADGQVPEAEQIKLFAKMFKVSTDDMVDIVARMFEVPELNRALVEKAATDLIKQAFGEKQNVSGEGAGHIIVD
ncbi:hypothetical protein MA9V1_017 [Chryseobacterium phage MA9V-1]|nr:hypothetical protein MA9V1_017 [Chryseobacterium phage MA9V-1]